MNFRIGQRVVRVGSGTTGCRSYAGNRPVSRPNLGEVCTVKTINHWPRGTLITLVEHDNSHLTVNGYEPGFCAKAFRPVVEPKAERKTDIGIFLKMLNPAQERVPS